MNININQGNIQENITSEIILKLYQIATAADNTVTLSGNLYSPTGYTHQLDYLNTRFAPNLTITVPENSRYLYFEDKSVETALLNSNIGDGVGISIPAAANATLTSSIFQNNTNIVKFDEFKYFTKANTNPPQGLFSGCSNLTSIDLSNCTAIGSNQFYGCSSLKFDVDDLSNITSIGDSGFNGVTIEGEIFKAPINTFSSNSLQGCTLNITGIDFSEGMLSVLSGPWNIKGFDNLTLYKFPKTLTQMDASVLSPRNKKYFVYGLDNITNMPEARFIQGDAQNPIGLLMYEGPYCICGNSGNYGDITSFHSLFFPKMKTTVSMSEHGNYGPQVGFFSNRNWANDRNIGKLVYFRDITSFGLGTFYKATITNLVINSTTVPTYDTTNLSAFNGRDYYTDLSTLFGNSIITTVWVPESAVSAYQSSPLFSGMTIKPIDLKTNGTDYDLPRFATYADWEAAYNASVANGTESPVGLIEEYM